MAKAHINIRHSLQEAKAIQAKYYNKNHKDVVFGENELVWLSLKNITTNRPKKKLDYKYVGPYRVKRVINPRVYKLNLPKSLSGIHPVFYISMLEKYHKQAINRQPNPAPVEIVTQEENAYVVDHIKEDKLFPDQNRYYKISWKGYGSDEDT